MPNFSKFLKNKEVVKLEIFPKKATLKFYFTLFLILGVFFLMFPLWKAGEIGVFLWLASLFILIFILTRQILSSKDRYLFTNKRVIHLRAINKKNYILTGAVRLADLEEIGMSGRSSLYLVKGGRKIYLPNITNRDQVFAKIETYLKP